MVYRGCHPSPFVAETAAQTFSFVPVPYTQASTTDVTRNPWQYLNVKCVFTHGKDKLENYFPGLPFLTLLPMLEMLLCSLIGWSPGHDLVILFARKERPVE